MPKLFLTLSTIILTIAMAYATPNSENYIDEALVFGWWDDGIIDANEAREILDLLQEGNFREACLLAEIYALESCPETLTETEKQPKKRKSPATKNKQTERPSLIPHGYVEWKGRTDSTGKLESHRTEININFYRYSLRLGSQELLTYKNSNTVAHFGQISTKELYSLIPIDTLWGTALYYAPGNFKFGALLDTSVTMRASISYIPTKNVELEAAYWTHTQNHTEQSLYAQLKSKNINLAAWWEFGQNQPLIKASLKNQEKLEQSNSFIWWKTSIYAHSDSVPAHSHLSATLNKSKFWSSQTFGVKSGTWQNQFTANARIVAPLHSDTTSTRIKLATEIGPKQLRTLASATCLEAENKCQKDDFSVKIKSALKSTEDVVYITGKSSSRYTRGKSFSKPNLETGVEYAIDAKNSVKLNFALPNANFNETFKIRSEANIGVKNFDFSLVVTFSQTKSEKLHPLHGYMHMRISF